MHISFVILHYITKKDTVECIESMLNNLTYSNYSIVVVDNGSPNKSGIELENMYKENPKVKVILSESNLGFAKGNNLGFKYAKEEEKADFIVLINNDTIVEQKDFCEVLIEEYVRDEFAIAGPDIISLIDNKHQNPIPLQFKSYNDVRKKILKLRILLLLNYFNVDSAFQLIKEKIKSRDRYKEKLDKDNTYQLHGSCIIFSRDYINNYCGLYENTFMYYEENILKYISERDNLKMIYLPCLHIYHKEDSSTNATFNKNNKKRRFYYNNGIKSCIELKKLMKKLNP